MKRVPLLRPSAVVWALLAACGQSSDLQQASSSAAAPDKRLTMQRLPGGEPMLRMPFAFGTVALCQQPPHGAVPLSHGYANTLEAIDFSVPGEAGVQVLAAADGLVRNVSLGATAGSRSPGGGFGNHVTVEHGSGYVTLYAHLRDVAVTPGQAVWPGSVLGTTGDTGLAGNVHLHFSLHKAEPSLGADAIPPTVPIHALITLDTEGGDAQFRVISSLELVCSHARVDHEGHLYASENRLGSAAHVGSLEPGEWNAIQGERDARVSAIDRFLEQLDAPRQAASGPSK
jgi:murein DD-endopeptidase MepM/ murein hydrolase activator NlpD